MQELGDRYAGLDIHTRFAELCTAWRTNAPNKHEMATTFAETAGSPPQWVIECLSHKADSPTLLECLLSIPRFASMCIHGDNAPLMEGLELRSHFAHYDNVEAFSLLVRHGIVNMGAPFIVGHVVRIARLGLVGIMAWVFSNYEFDYASDEYKVIREICSRGSEDRCDTLKCFIQHMKIHNQPAYSNFFCAEGGYSLAWRLLNGLVEHHDQRAAWLLFNVDLQLLADAPKRNMLSRYGLLPVLLRHLLNNADHWFILQVLNRDDDHGAEFRRLAAPGLVELLMWPMVRLFEGAEHEDAIMWRFVLYRCLLDQVMRVKLDTGYSVRAFISEISPILLAPTQAWPEFNILGCWVELIYRGIPVLEDGNEPGNVRIYHHVLPRWALEKLHVPSFRPIANQQGRQHIMKWLWFSAQTLLRSPYVFRYMYATPKEVVRRDCADAGILLLMMEVHIKMLLHTLMTMLGGPFYQKSGLPTPLIMRILQFVGDEIQPLRTVDCMRLQQLIVKVHDDHLASGGRGGGGRRGAAAAAAAIHNTYTHGHAE